MTPSKKPERDCDSMEVTLFNRGWNAAIDATTQPASQRTWVGLTDEEIEKACVPLGAAMLSFTEVARAIEAKLKEKNNG